MTTPTSELKLDPQETLELWHAQSKHKGLYDANILQAIKIQSIDPNARECIIELTTNPSLSNYAGIVHGGAIATIADITTSLAAFVLDGRYTVSVDLSVTFMRAIPLNTTVLIKNRVLRNGGSLVFLYCEFVDEKGTIYATCTHTKAVIKTAKL